jgi:hypothetical protein
MVPAEHHQSLPPFSASVRSVRPVDSSTATLSPLYEKFMKIAALPMHGAPAAA